MGVLDWLLQYREVLEAIAFVATIATAVGIFLALWQIRLAKQQALTDFEDDLNREYRELARMIPYKAILGEELEGEELVGRQI